MGYSHHSVDNLPSPFLLFDERVTDIPAGATLVTDNPFELKIVILLEGEFTQRVDAGPPFAYNAGDLVVYTRPCRQENTSVRDGEPSRLRVVRILFRNDSIRAARASSKKTRIATDEFSRFAVQEFGTMTHVREFLDEDSLVLLRRLRDEADRQDAGFRHVVHGVLMELVACIARRVHPSSRVDGLSHHDRSVAIVRRVEAFIATHFERRLTLDEIAWDQRLSAEHVSRVFGEQTGFTVFEYLDAVRIDASKGLLLDPGLTVEQVAKRCGYGSATRYGIHFKKRTGLTPSAYRAQLGSRLEYETSSLKRRS